MKTAEDMFAALGAGDLRLAQLVNLAQQLVEPERGNEQLELIPRKASYKPGKRGDIQIQGVGNLMTQWPAAASRCRAMRSSVTSPRAVA
jgi:GTP pyrophosphokinase